MAAASPPAATSAEPRPEVMLMTGLPLVWGEKGPFDPASKPAAAYLELSRSFAFRPIDILDRATLERGRLLFLAQPQLLAPSELAALDSWIRSGGRALILTDPILTWPSELPLGDIRRPPRVGLLSPLLEHWRLSLESPADASEVAAHWNGRRVVLDAPGRLRSSSPDCVVAPEDWTALCRLGRGQVRIVADADLMRDSLWAPSGPQRRVADNPDAVADWLDSLAGIERRRPSGSATRAGSGVMAVGLALVGLGLAGALLLRRRRKR